MRPRAKKTGGKGKKGGGKARHARKAAQARPRTSVPQTRYPAGTLTDQAKKLDLHDLDEARTLVTMARWAIEHGHPEVAERSLVSASRIFERDLGIGKGLRTLKGGPDRELVKLYVKYFEEAVAAYMLLSRLQRAREGKDSKRKAADLSEIALRIRSWYEDADGGSG